MTVEQTTVDPAKVQATMGKVVEELGVALGTLTATLGWRAGLWQAMAGAGPLTPAELAGQVGTAEAYAREWLKAQAAGGWVAYDPAGGRFTLPDEVAAALVHGPGGAILDACVTMLLAMGQDFPAYVEAFRGGQGVGWDQKSPAYLDGADALGRVALGPEQVGAFLDGLDGAGPRLDSGGRVADIGCGYGSPTIALATARPHARVDGFDAHDGSIARARRAAAAAGVAERVRFEVATAKDFPVPGGGYDLVTLFDVLHDLGDPVGALDHARAALTEGGAVMLVEPLGADRVEDNLNPLGRMWYGASVIACTPNALAQEGHALGTLAGEAALREVAAAAGFGRVRRVPVDAPLNLVLELRP
jgi:2-polyprenyl-3-methyl-5-hydroxy-6-metoxy-1,4-benzoquinol methylase